MVQGGTANPTNSDGFIENVVRYISEKEDLLQELQDLLTLNGFEKKGETFNESTIKHVSELLMNNEDLLKKAIDIVKKYLEKDNNQLKTLLEQVNKVKGMEGKLEALGNQLLAQGVISGAAVTTLTGALAGLLTVGGVTGALIVGGAAFVGFVALVAIAAIGYLIYQDRGEIKEGAIGVGEVMRSVMDHIKEATPEIKARGKNIDKLYFALLQKREQLDKSDEKEMKKLGEKIGIVAMLRDEKQCVAITELMKDGEINTFEEMERLLNKGNRVLESRMEAFEALLDKFIDQVVQGQLESFKQKVNDKVKEMKPVPQLDSPSSEQVNKEEKGVS